MSRKSPTVSRLFSGKTPPGTAIESEAQRFTTPEHGAPSRGTRRTGSLTFGGATYTATALVQLLQSLADALGAVDSAKASWQDALKNAADVKAKVGPVVQAYRSWVVATYGSAPSTRRPKANVVLGLRLRLASPPHLKEETEFHRPPRLRRYRPGRRPW